jgi:hypothetical protein
VDEEDRHWDILVVFDDLEDDPLPGREADEVRRLMKVPVNDGAAPRGHETSAVSCAGASCSANRLRI